ncbi:STAS domain-containing protein [Streptomyces sp. H27-H1]|uniref:STAS domain-containing protein n=1 Tax=Streptomyces sp. H27-H1 TaxID=2996461 RepID=UPI00226E0C56|nr:STAS domain-containing protein [Streptomyces sp. H27-H1]MCY0926830.1 STAS domain-containing protein [Streptomyces sp. H27-H1]
MSYDEPRVQVLLEEAGVRVVVLSGEFDMYSVEPLRETLAAAARDGVCAVVDIAAVVFADSTVLAALIEARRAGPLILVGPVPRQFALLLSMSGADSALETEPTREAALARAASPEGRAAEPGKADGPARLPEGGRVR